MNAPLSLIMFPHSVVRLGGGQEKQCLSERLQNRTVNGMREPRTRLTLIGEIVRRLETSTAQAHQLWAILRRDVSDSETMTKYVRTLRRCDKLKHALERSLGV